MAKWPENNPGSSPVEIAACQASESTELQVLASKNNKLREDIDYLNERLTRLTDSATYLENKPIRTHGRTPPLHGARYFKTFTTPDTISDE